MRTIMTIILFILILTPLSHQMLNINRFLEKLKSICEDSKVIASNDMTIVESINLIFHVRPGDLITKEITGLISGTKHNEFEITHKPSAYKRMQWELYNIQLSDTATDLISLSKQNKHRILFPFLNPNLLSLNSILCIEKFNNGRLSGEITDFDIAKVKKQKNVALDDGITSTIKDEEHYRNDLEGR